jgi:REP element-mobilizing transposase RayT
MSRGDRREDIFYDAVDRGGFLETLGRACGKTGWQVHAYCLMSNHFHLVVETPRANLVDGMKWLLGTYTMRFNRRHKLTGHLFAGRYKSLLIDESSPGYLRAVCDYVHLNPVRAGLLTRRQALEKYKWSSYPGYLRSARQRDKCLRCDRLMGEYGFQRDDHRSRLEFGRCMRDRQREANDAEAELIRRRWWYGAEDFISRLMDRASAPISVRDHHYASERSETDEQRAERIVRARLAKLGWRNQDLSTRRKSDPQKIRLAEKLRFETTVSLRWIAQRLEMGTWTHVSNLLQRPKRSKC